MYIRRLELLNFQKHKELTLDFNEKVNILYGVSGSGKSCIRRSIEWCLFNKNVDSVRKQGSKETSVKVFLSTGIWVERVRSASKNQYRFFDGKGQVSAFDAIGKTMPEEIRNAIGIFPIVLDKDEVYLNSSAQISLPFLFDVSGTERGKLFDKLTGNDVLSDVLIAFNKDLLAFGKDLKKEETINANFKTMLDLKSVEKQQSEAIYGKVKKLMESLNLKFNKYSKLLEIKDLVESNGATIKDSQTRLQEIKIPEVKHLQVLIEKFRKLEEIRNGLILNQKVLDITKTDLTVFRLPTSDSIEETRAKIKRFESLMYIRKMLTSMSGHSAQLKADLQTASDDIKTLDAEKTQYKVCDQCKGKGILMNG